MYFVVERKPYRYLFTILKQNSARFARILLFQIEIKGKRSILSQFEERALVRNKYVYSTRLLLLDKSDLACFRFKIPDIKKLFMKFADSSVQGAVEREKGNLLLNTVIIINSLATQL